MKTKKIFGIVALAAVAALSAGFGVANVTADAEVDWINDFTISQTSIRLGSGTENDPTGIRFYVNSPVDYSAGGADCYATFSLTTAAGKSWTTNVPATVWRPDGSGWNAVLLGIPSSDYLTNVTVTAYATVDNKTYQTSSAEANIAEVAAAVLEDEAMVGNLSATDKATLEAFTGKYTLAFADLGIANGEAFTSHTINDIITISADKESGSNSPKYYTTGSAIRLYGGNTMTVTVNNGDDVIKNISYTTHTSNGTFNTDSSIDPETSVWDESGKKITDINSKQVTIKNGGTSGHVRIQSLTIEIGKVSDEDKANAIADALSVTTDAVSAIDKEIALPTSEAAEVTWTVTAGEDYVELNGNTLTVTSLPQDADATVSVKATVKVGAVSVEKSFDITLVSYQTQLNVEKEALELDWNAITAAGEKELSVKGETYTNVSIAWVVTAQDGSELAWATIVDGTLNISELPAEETAIKLTATLTSGEVDTTKDFENITVAAAGSTAPEPETPEPQETKVSKTIAELITSEGWTSSTTKQSFDLDSVVSVKVGGGTNSGKAYEGDHIRIYATDSPAGSLTISLAEGYGLVSIKISTKTNSTYATLHVGDDTTTDISNVLTEVSGSSVVLNSIKNGSDGKQVRVTEIEVTYKTTTAS